MTTRCRRTAALCAFVAMPMLFLMLAGCFQRESIRVQDAGDGDMFGAVTTDKSRYNPGDPVRYTLKLNRRDGNGTLLVRYKHLDRIVEETEIQWDGSPEIRWEWKPPADDFKGYLTEIFLKQGSAVVDHANIAVDVSSDWGKFPRYGYLADFMTMEQAKREAVIDRLNRFHINGIQFYDWQWKHHLPLKIESGKPAATWPDIANREVSFETVKSYIDLAHERNMTAMNYNLLYGAYEDAEQDGVKKEWGLYKDPLHEHPDLHRLPDSWASDIVLMDPANPEWQRYLIEKEKEVFRHLPFDGWHVDQLGERGYLWTYDGKEVNLPATYGQFLQAAKKALDVDYVMNAVGQYGQGVIAAQAPVKFLYTEVWDDRPDYRHLKEIIDQNEKFGKGKLNTVLAAYMNYNRSNSPGEFNTPGVLLTDAVIFASGGSHLELGENMLSKEYFPHKKLTIPAKLEEQLVHYYDFLVAYQNLLRDRAQESNLKVTATNGTVLSGKAELGKVWTFAKRQENRSIVHFINFTGVEHMKWKDTNATQKEPGLKENVEIVVEADKKVNRVWMASPDFYNGSPVGLDFEQSGGRLRLTLPHLKYWDMLVMEYEEE
uniref:Dextranase 1 n=1 Tax=Paenibacillus sp. Dex70-34 TaxID=247651 RepID=Q6VUG7_9BACL|nr:dextranase 1 [Paenibacillus sp. Dex70-34]